MKTEKINVISIPPKSIVSLEISGLFYQRLNKFMIEFADSVSPEHLTLAIAKIQKQKTENDQFAYNLETLMVLLHGVEHAFKEAGETEDNELEVEVPDDFKKDPS